MLQPEERADGLTRHDLGESSLRDVIEDAQSLSLFATRRVIWVSGAELALPRGRVVADEEGKDERGAPALASLVRRPVPGVSVVFDCQRFELDGDDKSKLQRVQKFYAAVPAQVEFARLTVPAARKLAQELARQASLEIGGSELDLLVESVGADGARLAAEVEKLRLYCGTGRRVSSKDVFQLVPNAAGATIFTLVAALGRGDRSAALKALDILVREGEYLPLALAFIATQFRLALAAREARLTNVAQVQSHFTRAGIGMWRSRAEQVTQTANAFPEEKLQAGIKLFYGADKALRDARPDDRTVMEQLIFALT